MYVLVYTYQLQTKIAASITQSIETHEDTRTERRASGVATHPHTHPRANRTPALSLSVVGARRALSSAARGRE